MMITAAVAPIKSPPPVGTPIRIAPPIGIRTVTGIKTRAVTARSPEHVIDDALRNTRLAQARDVFGVEVINRPLVAQITQDDGVANMGAGQRLDIVQAQVVAMHHLVVD